MIFSSAGTCHSHESGKLGRDGAARDLDGLDGGGGSGQVHLEGFFQFAGGDDFDARFVDPFLIDFQGLNDGFGVDDLVGFEFVEGLQSNDDGIA